MMHQQLSASAPFHDDRLGPKDPSTVKLQESTYSKRNAGRQREEGTVLRVVRAVAGSAVRPLLVSQSSLPAVGHAAPTIATQPSLKHAKALSAAEAAAEAAAAAASAHTAMLNRFRAEWQITKQDSIWQRLYKHMEWRLFWVGHTNGIFVLDYEERVIVSLLYLAVFGLLLVEGWRRLAGGLQGMW